MYGPSQEVKFEREAEAILLEVPLEGIHYRGWKITPLAHPAVSSGTIITILHFLPAIIHSSVCGLHQIMKEAVDNYQPGMQIPSCSLLFNWTRDSPPVNETYTLRLQGAREPYNYFNIDCELQQGTLSST